MKKYFSYVAMIIVIVGLVACQQGDYQREESAQFTTTEMSLTQTPLLISQQSTATPEFTMEYSLDDLLIDLPYTAENPLGDIEEIQTILKALQERELAWFSREGWVLVARETPTYTDFSGIEYIWTHVVNTELECREQFVYFEYQESILPFVIRLEDGALGYIIPVLEGQFNEENVHEESPDCDLGNGESIKYNTNDEDFILHDESDRIKKILEKETIGVEYSFQVWLEKEAGRDRLVLFCEVNFADTIQRGVVEDPITGDMIPVAKNLKYSFIDMETGLLIHEVEEFYGGDDRLITGSHLEQENGIWYSYQFYDMLPEAVSQVYEETVEALEAYLKN